MQKRYFQTYGSQASISLQLRRLRFRMQQFLLNQAAEQRQREQVQEGHQWLRQWREWQEMRRYMRASR